jgi:hypothetical protein
MDLVIAQSVNDFASLEKLLLPSTDILALDQSVMVALDAKRVKYKVIEDFYTADQYYLDACIYHQKVDNLFDQLDKACESILNFPYAYSGNEHYLLTWFDDLLYLEKLIQTIQNKYEKVYLYATDKPKKISSNYFNFSMLNSYKVNGTISFPVERSTKRKIQLIYNSIDLCFVKDANSSQKSVPLKNRIRQFFNRLHRYVGKRVNVSLATRWRNTGFRKNIYVIQDAYEVHYLKKYLSEFKYLTPVTKLRQDIEMEQPVDISDSFIDNILKSFIKEHFSFLGEYVYLFINSYHIEVVGRISLFKEKFKFLIKKDNPSLLLLSIGTRDVFDLVCCYVANNYNIPVILFQHGGHGLFRCSPYQKSLEHNQKVLKTLIAQSNKEVDKIQNEETEVLCMGSIQQYKKKHTSYIKKPTKDILFCLGPDTNLVFRQLLNYYSINKKHHQSIDVMATVEGVPLSVDIKLHPTGERSSYDSYINIIKNHKYKNINVLYGSFGEVVSGNYKLIIVDFLASALTNDILSLKIPVIIYDCDFDKIRISDDVLSDLCKRCYIARNKRELSKFLERYKAGNLPSKWSVDFIDKYIYPVDNGAPGENTAKYICNIVK